MAVKITLPNIQSIRYNHSLKSVNIVIKISKNMFIFQTNAIWADTICVFLCCVHFLSPLVISAHSLVQNKVTWGPRHWSLSTFSKKLWSFNITAIYSFLPINENAFYKATHINQNSSTKCSIIGPWIYVWPVNLRVYPQKKLDLRVARKSTTSPLPGYRGEKLRTVISAVVRS